MRGLDLSSPSREGRFAVLIPHDQNSNVVVERPINHGVGEHLERKGSPALCRWRPEAGLFGQKPGDAFELVEEAGRDHSPGMFLVEAQSTGEVLLRSRVERIVHCESVARSLATASGPGVTVIEPDSSSASR